MVASSIEPEPPRVYRVTLAARVIGHHAEGCEARSMVWDVSLRFGLCRGCAVGVFGPSI